MYIGSDYVYIYIYIYIYIRISIYLSVYIYHHIITRSLILRRTTLGIRSNHHSVLTPSHRF